MQNIGTPDRGGPRWFQGFGGSTKIFAGLEASLSAHYSEAQPVRSSSEELTLKNKSVRLLERTSVKLLERTSVKLLKRTQCTACSKDNAQIASDIGWSVEFQCCNLQSSLQLSSKWRESAALQSAASVLKQHRRRSPRKASVMSKGPSVSTIEECTKHSSSSSAQTISLGATTEAFFEKATPGPKTTHQQASPASANQHVLPPTL